MGREVGGSFVYSKNNRKSSFENGGNVGNYSGGGSFDDSNLIGVGPSGKQHSLSQNRVGGRSNAVLSEIDSRERVMLEKERKKKDEEEK